MLLIKKRLRKFEILKHFEIKEVGAIRKCNLEQVDKEVEIHPNKCGVLEAHEQLFQGQNAQFTKGFLISSIKR
jgi:putative ubiquitin-RnfH superfamily antitoxin RatB of RatAB toxin-antitoxin module